jgi:hypothetical protein
MFGCHRTKFLEKSRPGRTNLSILLVQPSVHVELYLTHSTVNIDFFSSVRKMKSEVRAFVLADASERHNMREDSSTQMGTSSFFDGPLVYPPVPNAAALEADDRSLPQPVHALVNLDVPHIHQLWDTANDFDGHWACGAVSSTMVLAYYGLLETHPITVNVPRQGAHSSNFGWYLSNTFVHNGHTFNATAQAPGRLVPGIYGTVLDNHPGIGWATAPDDLNQRNKGIRVLMKHFLPGVENTMTVQAGLRSLARADVEASFKQTLDSGHPVIVSGTLFSWQHIIVLRGYAKNPVNGHWQWIVNDPFGYRTDGRPGGDNVVYEYDEIKPKWMVRFAGPHTPANA